MVTRRFMARIVFAGELVSSRNPLGRLLASAERMRADGHAVSFVITDLVGADASLTPRGIPFVPAPRLASQPFSSHRPPSYWKILAGLGYDDRDFLRARVRAWMTLFDWLAADTIVTDRAPTARLAAEISQRQWQALDADFTPPLNRHSDAAVFDNIEAVRRELSQDRLRDLPMRPYSKPPKNRRRILFAWELGTNAGHLERGIAIANALRACGHEVIFIVRDVDLAERLLVPEGFDFLPIACTPLAPPQRATVNFSDVLLTCGFADADALRARVRAWTHLLGELDADTMVIDHAPTAQVAAYVVNLPSILVNSGFSIPPVTQPFPSIQPHLRISTEQLALADQRALTTVNEVVGTFGARPLSHLSELFARSTQIITTFKELDPYSKRGAGLYVGPVEHSTQYRDEPWRTTGKIRVFVYMRPFIRGVEALLRALQACDAEVKFVMPGAAPALVTKYQAAHFEIHTEPIELGSLLKEADLVISYGSATLLAQSLLAGVPLLLIPDVLEQIINSMRVVEMGAGVLLLKERDPAAISGAIGAVTSQARFRTAARAFAAKYQAGERGACERIVAAIEQVFECGPGATRNAHPRRR